MIGLISIRKAEIPTIKKLSSRDYKSMTGIKVRYAGFGTTGDLLFDEFRPLQLGEFSALTIHSIWPQQCV